MGEFGDWSQAWLAGLVCGFVVSVPVGPLNLTVINTALRRGFLRAFLTGLGAVTAESVYAALALAGYSSLLDSKRVKYGVGMVALVFIVALGLRSLFYREEKVESRDAARAERVSERWHHPRAYALGFVLTISNLGLVVLWATLAAVLFARDWVQTDWASRGACLAGVACGGATWFCMVAFFVSRAHRRVSARALTLAVRASGVVLLCLGGLLAFKIFYGGTR